MEKKRSIGVTIFAGLLIIYAIVGLSRLMRPCILTSQVCPIGNPIVKGYLQFIYSFLIPALSLIAGIFILRLKEWARKLAIILRVIILIFIFINWLPFIKVSRSIKFNAIMNTAMQEAIESNKQEIQKLYKPEYQEEYLKKQEKVLGTTIKAMPIFISFILFLGIAWNAIIIFFFTRPKVKAQFIPEQGEGESFNK